MSDEQEKLFTFALDSDQATPEIIQMLINLRASVDALAVLVIELSATAMQKNPVEVAERYSAMTADNVLRHAFTVQDSARHRKSMFPKDQT